MSLAIVALSLAGAAGLYFGMTRWGGPELRGWAAPGAAALVCGGVGHVLNLPSWLTVGAFLGALFFLNKKARERLASEARAVGSVQVKELDMALEPMPTPAGNRVAAWSGRDGKDPDPVVFTLEYAGEKEEELEVTLAAVAARFRPGVLAAHRAGAGGAAAALLAGCEPLTGLAGQTDELVLRCLPPDFGFAVLDLKTLSAIQELNQLARPDREVYLHANGPELKVVCQGLPGREDIRRMLTRAAIVAARLRFLGRQEIR